MCVSDDCYLLRTAVVVVVVVGSGGGGDVIAVKNYCHLVKKLDEILRLISSPWKVKKTLKLNFDELKPAQVNYRRKVNFSSS